MAWPFPSNFQFDNCDKTIKLFQGTPALADNEPGVESFCKDKVPGVYSGMPHFTLDLTDMTDSTRIWEFEFSAVKQIPEAVNKRKYSNFLLFFGLEESWGQPQGPNFLSP